VSSKGHSSYLVWRVIKDRAIQKIIPALGKRSKAQGYFSVFLIIVSILAAVGIGIYIDGYAIHPPSQYTGICPPPAQIHGQSCTYSQVEVVTSGTVTKETTIQIPAGTIINAQTTTTTTVTVTK
jgi:hypothetical protein